MDLIFGNDFASFNVLAATPSKADFSTFSTVAENYKILVKGTGANANDYQVWTTDKDGTVLSKDGYSDYNTTPVTKYSYYTLSQAVSSGLEDIFSKDLQIMMDLLVVEAAL